MERLRDSLTKPTRKKLVVYGGKNTGKTSLLINFTTQKFSRDYVPRTIENVVGDLKVDGRSTELLMCEAQGYSTMYHLARTAFQDIDVVLMCFSLTSLDSLKILPKLVDRLKDYGLHKAPIVLVGTKNDEQQSRNITFTMGSCMAQQIKAVHYVQCSSKTGEGVKEVFEAAVRSVSASKPPKIYSFIEPTRKQLIVYGGKNTGKTSLLINFISQNFRRDYVPSTIENVVREVEVDGRSIELFLSEAQGYSTMYNLAQIAFKDADAVLMCFSLTSLDSLEILPELVERVQCYGLHKAPIVLVGTKNDEQESRDITFKMGFDMAQQIKAVHYVECSSKTGEGVKEVFEAAVRSVSAAKPQRRSLPFPRKRNSQENQSPPGDKPKWKRWSQYF